MLTNKIAFSLLITSAVLVQGCQNDNSVGSESSRPAPALPSPSQDKQQTGLPFANRVWVVSSSKQVEKGQIYVFASTGDLFIASSHGKPSTGSWKYEKGQLTITEDVSYKVDIVEQTDLKLKLKINGPSPVEMTLVAADPVPLNK